MERAGEATLEAMRETVVLVGLEDHPILIGTEGLRMDMNQVSGYLSFSWEWYQFGHGLLSQCIQSCVSVSKWVLMS